MKKKMICIGIVGMFLLAGFTSVSATLEDNEQVQTDEEKTGDIVVTNLGGQLKWEYGYIFIGCYLKVWLPRNEAPSMISALKNGVLGYNSVQKLLHSWFPDMDVAWSWGYYMAYTAQFHPDQVDDIEDANGANGVVFQCNMNWLDYPTFFSFSNIRSQ